MTVKRRATKRSSLQRSVPQQSKTPSKSPTRQETAEYICAMCDELVHMSAANKFNFLTYLLNLAHAEAERVVEYSEVAMQTEGRCAS